MLLAADFVMQVITRQNVLNCFNQEDKPVRGSDIPVASAFT